MAVVGGVAARDVVLQLTLDVREERGGTDSVAVGFGPLHAEFLFHEDQAVEGLFRRADSPSGLEADHKAGALKVVADLAGHDEAVAQSRVGGLFAGAGLDEVRARHHAHQAGPRDIGERA